jgi:hypothetical protein
VLRLVSIPSNLAALALCLRRTKRLSYAGQSAPVSNAERFKTARFVGTCHVVTPRSKLPKEMFLERDDVNVLRAMTSVWGADFAGGGG